MKTIVCRIDLGYTRTAGYTLYDTDTMDFQETTPKEVWELVRVGKVNGLVLNTKEEIVPDLFGWNLGNIKIKSGVGNYRNYDENTEKTGSVYSVVRVIDIEDVGRVYELISNKCARIIFTEKQLIELSKLAWIGGVFVNEDTGEVQLCNNVKIENHTNRTFFELGSQVIGKNTLESLFGNTTEPDQAHESHEEQLKGKKESIRNSKSKKSNK